MPTDYAHDTLPLLLVVVACGVVCVTGYLAAFALGRRVFDVPSRPTIAASDLIKPLACGMLSGLLMLACRFADNPWSSAVAQPSAAFAMLLSVSLIGVCAGGWTARPRPGRTSIAAADLVRRLCVATNSHEDATARVAVRLALAAGFDPAHAGDLMAAASLHDIGRAALPEALLRRQGASDDVEGRLLQAHTRLGYRLLARSREPMLDLAADIALHHHERWDGAGYPERLAGEAIPLTSRAVSLAELFDNIRSAQSPAEITVDDQGAAALARRVRDTAAGRCDPHLVELLLADLPGMIAAHRGNTAAAHEPATSEAGSGALTWLRPGRFQPLPLAARGRGHLA